VRRFQSSRGLPATGVADAATAAAMGLIAAGTPAAPPPAPAPANWTNLRMGSRGATVAATQRAVLNSGIFLRGGADGIYGSYTTAAVRLYQANRGLPQTGVVDAAIAQAMGLFTPSGPVGAIQPGGPAPARSYTVVRGDSLNGIARKNGIAIGDLLALNNLYLSSVIHPGMVLTVAAGSGAAAASVG
jgi:peptidoglycan hydrolase-like protein with peptidoglycan-binding domain